MRTVLAVLTMYINYYIIHRANKIAYLRSLGVSVGKNCQILNNVNSFSTEPWLISIGNDVTITVGVMLITHDGSSRVFRSRFSDMNKYGNKFGKISIGDNCFIGVNSILLPGITIGSNSIVAVGSVVARDVPANSVVAGNPARVVSTLEQHIENYRKDMLSLQATTREELRTELDRLLNA